MIQLSSHRPYLLRAFYDWLIDNQLVPYLVVDVTTHGVVVPMEFANNGKIILNIAPRAVENLSLGNDKVQFNTCFGGVSRQVVVPMIAVMAIYDNKNGVGTIFEPESSTYEEQAVVMNSTNSAEDQIRRKIGIQVVIDGDRLKKSQTENNSEDDSPLPKRLSGHRPSLRLVK